VKDVEGRIAVVGDCVVLAGSALGDDLPIVWPEGTTVSVDSANKISLMNGSFLIGDEIAPAQGWTTTMGELSPDVVEGLDTACNTGNSAAAIVLSKVKGMPTQE